MVRMVQRVHIGDRPSSMTAAYPLWYNTRLCNSEGLYIWEDVQEVWINTNTPGPKGDDGDGLADLTFVAPIQRVDDDVVFSWNSINELPD